MKTLRALIALAIPALLIALAVAPAAPAEDADDDDGVADAEVEPAKAARARHEARLLAQPGVQAVGVGLTDGRRVGLQVFVKKGRPKPALPKHLDGVPVKVVEAERFVAHEGPCDAGGCHADIEPLPARMGTSTGNVSGIFAGTLGYRVHRRGDPAQVGYLTVNHLAGASGPALCPAQLNPANLPAFRLDQCQPGQLDAPGFACVSTIGGVVQVVPIVMGAEFLNTVDAAFVESSRGCVSKVIRDVGPPARDPAFPKLDQTLRMSGRSSGLRKVRVAAINVTVSVDYGPSCGTARLVNQAITVPVNGTTASRPGDSGAPLVNGGRRPVGLNYAGDGYFGVIIPMPLVLDALGVQIDNQPDAPGSTCTP